MRETSQREDWVTVLAHREFLEAIAARAGLDRPDAAKQPAQSVLVGVARRVDDPGRKALRSTLPSQLAGLVGDQAPLDRDALDRDALDRGKGRTPFLQTVASELKTSPERARFLAQAVLSALADQDAPTAEAVRSQLPEDFAELFTPPGEGPPPDRTATAAMPEPTDLTAEEVAAALASLPGWTGDVRALERTVTLPPGIGQEIRDRIARVEQSMSHHAVIDERPDGTVFRVWTHARGAVTNLDVELARRISEIVEGS